MSAVKYYAIICSNFNLIMSTCKMPIFGCYLAYTHTGSIKVIHKYACYQGCLISWSYPSLIINVFLTDSKSIKLNSIFPQDKKARMLLMESMSNSC